MTDRDDKADVQETDMNAWRRMADWSDLPDVYVTDVEQLDGVVWRVQACSVPLATAPEVRLVPAARIAALEAEVARLRGALDKMQRSRDRYRQQWEAEKARWPREAEAGQ